MSPDWSRIPDVEESFLYPLDIHLTKLQVVMLAAASIEIAPCVHLGTPAAAAVPW